MENIEYSNSLYQIYEIIKYMAPNLKARIPKKFISYFENNKSKDYNWKIDEVLPLEKQNLLLTTKEILTVLYRDYICDDLEKIKVNKILNDNEIEYQNQLKEKYNFEDIFKNKSNKEKNTTIENEQISVITYKKSFLSKIINKIKPFFSK